MIWIIVGVIIFLFIFDVGLASYIEYQKKIISWCDERELIFHKIFQEAEVVTSIPQHSQELLIMDGQIVHAGGLQGPFTPINYQTLVPMVKIMMEQEDSRQKYSVGLTKSLEDLRTWETNNPLPKKPRFVR